MSPEAGTALSSGEEDTLVVAKSPSVTYSDPYFDIVVPTAYASRTRVESHTYDDLQNTAIWIDGTFVSEVAGFCDGPAGDPATGEVIVATLADSAGHAIQVLEDTSDPTSAALFEDANVLSWVRPH